MKGGLINQTKREISVMRIIKHPNVVRLYEVIASKSKIYFVMEYVRGGELFNKVTKGKLKEDNGNLKVSDLGLTESRRQDGLLHTTCGTPAYVAPEVINKKGYDRAKADIWSCGVILYVLLAVPELVAAGGPEASFSDPRPEPEPEPADHDGEADEEPFYSSTSSSAYETSSEDESTSVTPRPMSPIRPNVYNAFDIISPSQGYDLSGLFEEDLNQCNSSRFTTKKPARNESFNIRNDEGKVRLQGIKEGRKGQLAIGADILEVTPSFHVEELNKTSGDTLEYKNFCNQELKPSLQDIVWTWQGHQQQTQ
ncbi:putative Delay of germination 1 [Hibiscus syriacus]|uniref:non-specific serine/threonine protein kinase n=1 Tax=Hibiscus syriacus TaxID=106335 RepID=A0A6A2WNS3_HIBSY|nr:putative Delay of germination 1 [Hibiscus syriacus]